MKGSPIELGQKNTGKLLMEYAVPAIIAMTASSLYNITDSIFIGHGVGSLALSGLTISFPLMNLAAAFGSLVGVGGSTLLSVRLGQKDYKTANYILGNVFIMNLIIGISFSIITLLFLDSILLFFGASENTLPYAREFMCIILLGNVVTHMYLGLNSMLRSAGQPEKSMYATIFTVIINLILNPLFIFVFKWGIKGSALATITSQIIVLFWQIKLFSNKNSFIHFKKGIFKLKKRIIFDSLSIGMSPFLMNAAACVIVILINQGLKKHGGDLAVGAYGIVNRVAYLSTMVVMGLNQGMQPIIGYNYGAKLYSRVNDVLKKTIILATLVMTSGFIFVELFPHTTAAIFTNEEELTEIASKGLRITFLFSPVIGFQMVVATFFQSIGRANKSIFMSLTRQILFLVPCLLILPNFLGISGIWYSMPISDCLAGIIAAILLYMHYRKFRTDPS